MLTEEDGEEAKVSPPIRSSADRDAVKQALVAGQIDTIGSDHIAYTRLEKQLGTFWEHQTAFGGCGLILPVAISSGLPLEVVAAVTSTGPARSFGLFPHKGSLEPGADADFVLIDIEETRSVKIAESFSSSDFSVYEGALLRGWPVMTVARGDVIFENGHFPAAPGRGRFLFRGPHGLRQRST